MRGFLRMLCWLMLAPASLAEDHSGRHLSLRQGDTEEVSYPPGTDLTISRRGLVEAFHVGDGRWQLTALRPGFVVVDAHDAATGEVRWPRLFVDVSNRNDQDTAAKPILEMPTWLCEAPGVRCDRGASLVAGVAPSLVWFLHGRDSCQALPGCYFAVEISSKVANDWVRDLKDRLGSAFSVAANLHSLAGPFPLLAEVEAYCGRLGRKRLENEIDARANKALTAGLLLLRCLDEEISGRYRLYLRMYLVENDEVEGLGLVPDVQAKVSIPVAESTGTLFARLDALVKKHRAEMIGEPVIRLNTNQPVELTSGGEFQVIEHVLRSERLDTVPERANWKQQGLQLKATVTALQAGMVHLAYEMTFKARAESGDAVGINELKSEIDLPMAVPVMVGVLDMRAHDDDVLGLPVLKDLPLIGPLFRHNSTQQSNSRLLLWFTVEADQDGRDLSR